METGVNSTWRENGQYSGDFHGYTVNGLKYISPAGEVGWHITSWPMQEPIHSFWVQGSIFYQADIEVDEFLAGLYSANIHEQVEDVEQAEQKAVLAAIELWAGSPDLH